MLYALLAALVMAVISLSGIALFLGNESVVKRGLFIMVAFAAAALLGNVFFHLLPESYELLPVGEASIWVLAGIVLMLVVEGVFHCSHDSHHELGCKDKRHKHEHLAPLNLLGDAVHNFMDGIALGAAFMISPEVGVATTVAIALHEIPQELADASLLSLAGWSKGKVVLSNFLVSLTALLGVVLVFTLGQVIEGVSVVLLPLAAGQLLYIALADVAPAIHTHGKVSQYILQAVAFAIGLGIMWAVTVGVIGDDHGHSHGAEHVEEIDHTNDDHDHDHEHDDHEDDDHAAHEEEDHDMHNELV